MSRLTLYLNINTHLLQDSKPSIFMESVFSDPLFMEYPYNMLYELKSAEQHPKHHPEGNVWNHTMLVIDEAAKAKSQSKYPTVFMWAALLHDISKPACFTVDVNGRGHFYGHHTKSAEESEKILRRLGYDDKFINEVKILIQYHYIKEIVSNVKEKGIKKFIDSVGEERLDDMLELIQADMMGKPNTDNIEVVQKLRDLSKEYLNYKDEKK